MAKKEIFFSEFMQIQTRWLIFHCNTKGLDYVESALKYGAALRAKLESKYIILNKDMFKKL